MKGVGCQLVPLPSEQVLLNMPSPKLPESLQVGAYVACVGTIPHEKGDFNFLMISLENAKPVVVVLDCHPSLSKRVLKTPRLRGGRRVWSWNLEASSYGEPQSRTRGVVVSSSLGTANTDNMAPQYITDVRLPAVISEYLRATDYFLTGTITLCPKNAPAIDQPTPLGWMSMNPETRASGAKTPQGVIQLRRNLPWRCGLRPV